MSPTVETSCSAEKTFESKFWNKEPANEKITSMSVGHTRRIGSAEEILNSVDTEGYCGGVETREKSEYKVCAGGGDCFGSCDQKDNLNRFSGSSDSLCQNASDDRSLCTTNCGRCHCRCSSSKRRCSASDIINMKSGQNFLTNSNSVPLRKSNIVGTNKSAEKIEKINLANLVFNPNFKNSSGCVNLPVINAGQNLAHKNAQRCSSVNIGGSTKDPLEDFNKKSNFSSSLDQVTRQAAIDLITKQLQPQSLNNFNVKLQHQNQLGDVDKNECNDLDIGDIIHTFTGKGQAPCEGNAARYKTELCRSYEEGGECRFGTACTFAHGAEELRPVPRHPLYKTEYCRTYHQHGYCQYGTRCHFMHDAEEADKNAPLKGCKSWGRHDQLSGALLSLASSSGILDEGEGSNSDASGNDVLLANLRRLYALRTFNGQEKSDSTNQFSSTQPMAQQLNMAHQQISDMSATRHLPLSMTQPLPMEAVQMGLHRAGQMNQMAQMQHHPNNRVESIANDYSSWGVAPPSPTYSGLSPFGSYQQFSPLPHQPHHPGGHSTHQHHHQAAAAAYPHYPFSATAPDLAAALKGSHYAMSPPAFSQTVNVGHLLPDQNGNYLHHQAAAPAASNLNLSSKGNVPINAPISSKAPTSMPNPQWPQTSAEVSSAIDRELFGFGLDSQQQQSHQAAYQQYYKHPYIHRVENPHIQHISSSDGMKKSSSSSRQTGSSQQHRSSEHDLMSFMTSDKYADSKYSSLRPISEFDEHVSEQQIKRNKRGEIHV